MKCPGGGGGCFFQNEANFNPREAYLKMKISCKFGEASRCSFPADSIDVENLFVSGGRGIVNTKPKYPMDASGGYS